MSISNQASLPYVKHHDMDLISKDQQKSSHKQNYYGASREEDERISPATPEEDDEADKDQQKLEINEGEMTTVSQESILHYGGKKERNNLIIPLMSNSNCRRSLYAGLVILFLMLIWTCLQYFAGASQLEPVPVPVPVPVPAPQEQIVPIISIEEMWVFQDPTSIKGKTKEAYGFFLCSRNDPQPDPYYEALVVTIHRLKNDTARDIIVIVCQYTSQKRYEKLNELGVLVVPVQTINPPVNLIFPRWLDDCTKFIFWKFTQFDRILMLDLDIIIIHDFYSIWDEEVTQIKYRPPDGFSLDSEYLGVPLKLLYPYTYAGAIDTSNWPYNKEIDKFNAGLFLMKPSLVHFKLIMDTAFNTTYQFTETDQSILNFIYGAKGPMPWGRLSVEYNYYPVVNPMGDFARAYHWKVWESPPVMDNITQAWNITHDEIYKDFEPQSSRNLTDLPLATLYINISSSSNSITIKDLNLYRKEKALFYAIASTDLTIQPKNSQFIMDSHLAYGEETLIINGLLSNSTYMVYYCAYSYTSSRLSDMFYVKYNTQAS